MTNIYTTEIKKALSTKWFFVALGIGCALAVATFALNAALDFQGQQRGLPLLDRVSMMLGPLSCFKYWIVTDYLQPTTDLFFLLVPLLAVLPYAWSFASERNTGSIKNALTRTSRKSYFVAKYLATFLSGGLVVMIPIVLNLILCACTMPAYMPDIDAVLYVGIDTTSMWSEIYYNMPLLYCLMFILLNFVFAGLWASVVMSISFYIRNRIALMVGPYLFLIFLKFFEEKLFAGEYATHLGVVPFSYLRSVTSSFTSNEYVILAEFALFIVVILAITLANYRRDVL